VCSWCKEHLALQKVCKVKVIEFKKNNQAFTNVCHELTAKKIPHTPGVMHHFDYNEYSIVIETKDEEVFEEKDIRTLLIQLLQSKAVSIAKRLIVDIA